MALNVKAFLEKKGDVKGEIRRFQVSANSSGLYEQLIIKVAEIFALPQNGFRLYWQDSDGDFITFSSTIELREAIQQSSDNVLRLFVRLSNGDQDKASSQGASNGEETQEEKVRHPGVICDGCEKGIYGPRYKCVICPDYDLCETCEQKGIHPEHDKFKITHPLNAGGPGGFMPPHFRRWMHRFMKKYHPTHGHCPAGTAAPGQPADEGSSSGPQQQQEDSMGSAEEEYLKTVGENISAFLDPFGIDVTYEVQHGDQKSKGRFHSGKRGAGRCGGMWQWGMFGNPAGCTSMPNSSESTSKQETNKPAETQPSEEMRAEAEMEIPVTVEKETPEPKKQDAPQSREASPAGIRDDDWTMLNGGDVATDGSEASAEAQREGLYPNLKVAQALEMMKAMGFADENGWLTRLLETTDGDIARALDTLKLGTEQASRLG